jgi:hypothetical protein
MLPYGIVHFMQIIFDLNIVVDILIAFRLFIVRSNFIGNCDKYVNSFDLLIYLPASFVFINYFICRSFYLIWGGVFYLKSIYKSFQNRSIIISFCNKTLKSIKTVIYKNQNHLSKPLVSDGSFKPPNNYVVAISSGENPDELKVLKTNFHPDVFNKIVTDNLDGCKIEYAIKTESNNSFYSDLIRIAGNNFCHKSLNHINIRRDIFLDVLKSRNIEFFNYDK